MYLQCKPSLLWLFLHLENKGGNTLVTGSYLLDRKSELLGCSNRYWWDIYPIKLNYALFISFPPLETGSWWITNAWLLAKGRMGRAFSFLGQYILGTQKSLRQFVETVGVRFLGSPRFCIFHMKTHTAFGFCTWSLLPMLYKSSWIWHLHPIFILTYCDTGFPRYLDKQCTLLISSPYISVLQCILLVVTLYANINWQRYFSRDFHVDSARFKNIAFRIT